MLRAGEILFCSAFLGGFDRDLFAFFPTLFKNSAISLTKSIR